jgi:hypothetical protein
MLSVFSTVDIAIGGSIAAAIGVVVYHSLWLAGWLKAVTLVWALTIVLSNIIILNATRSRKFRVE